MNLNLNSSENLISFSNKYDLTDCVWPRHSFYSDQCSFPLPKFELETQNTIQVGSNILVNIEKQPFSSPQNAKFLMRVLNESNATPNWVQVNNNNMTVSILTSKVSSVGTIKLSFEAQLITTQYPNDNYKNYTTKPIFAFFSFENSNCELKSVDKKDYLVIDKMTTFNFKFFDEELDYVTVKMNDSNAVSSYTIFNLTTFSSQVLLQSFKVSEYIENLVFFYTDLYHQDTLPWRNFTQSVNLFASEPPIFNSVISNIFADRWQNKVVVLPSVSDSDSPNSR